MSKIRPGKPVSGQPSGTTFQKSTTQSFNKGNSGGSAPNGIIPVKAGATITCNDPAINFPKASSTPAHGGSKLVKSASAKQFVPNGTGTLSKNDSSVK